MVFLDGDNNRNTDVLESLLWYISNKVLKRLRGNVPCCSMVERLTKQYIRVKEVESDFEEREHYVVLEWYKAPVAVLWSWEEVGIYRPRMFQRWNSLYLKLLLRETCGYISFEVLLRLELYWAQLGFTKVTSYTHGNCKYSFQWNDMIGSLDDQEEDSEIEWLNQIQCRRTGLYKKSVISGSHSRKKREAHYSPVQHLCKKYPTRDSIGTICRRRLTFETYWD
jgi:hypothetical protein